MTRHVGIQHLLDTKARCRSGLNRAFAACVQALCIASARKDTTIAAKCLRWRKPPEPDKPTK
ncbi:MAG TPA: hypothetical protein VER96_00680 [Polyangiaceae bacterium]|nr:hypothetical protein [Polyangiaceae bacterium]